MCSNFVLIAVCVKVFLNVNRSFFKCRISDDLNIRVVSCKVLHLILNKEWFCFIGTRYLFIRWNFLGALDKVEITSSFCNDAHVFLLLMSKYNRENFYFSRIKRCLRKYLLFTTLRNNFVMFFIWQEKKTKQKVTLNL